MKISIDDRAVAWFEREFDLQKGEGIRIYGKGYGETNVHDGFSVAIMPAIPIHPIASVIAHEHPYFVEEQDAWFVAELDLHIAYDETLDEPTYIFEEQKG